jgi:hypothetical protein
VTGHHPKNVISGVPLSARKPVLVGARNRSLANYFRPRCKPIPAPIRVEIYFSVVQRKLLTPNDFSSLEELEQRLLAFQGHYQQSASPFKWTFTRRDLHTLLEKIENRRLAPAA